MAEGRKSYGRRFSVQCGELLQCSKKSGLPYGRPLFLDYLPRKRNTAAPSARRPVKMALLKTPNAARAANRKNRTINHEEIDLGMFILHSPLAKLSMRL